MRSLRRRPVAAAAVAALLAAATSCAAGPAPPPATAPAPSLEPADPRLTAASPDGKYRLRIEGMHGGESTLDHRRGRTYLWACLVEPDPETFLADENPRARLVTAEGRDIPQELEGEGYHLHWSVDSRERGFLHVFDAGRDAATLASARYEVAILRVRSWETCAAAADGRGPAFDIEASPFRLRVEPGPQVCRVEARGGTPEFLDASWAMETLEVTDSRGRRLESLRGRGDRNSYYCDFAAPKADGTAGVPIAYPLAVRLRVPKEYDIESVPFEFRDVVLPARPGGAPAKDQPWSGWSRSGWSERHDGLGLRIDLPAEVVRGDLVAANLGVSFDPGSVPPGGFSMDELDAKGRLRLVLRNRDSGATVDLRPTEEPRGRDAAVPEESREGAAPAAGLHEWPIQFPLAAAWDSLVPGTWEARATLMVPPNPDSPAAWSGTFSTEPIPFIVTDQLPPFAAGESPRTSILRWRGAAPTAVRLRPGEKPGTVDVAFGPTEAEVVEVELRNGFTLGVECGEPDMGGGNSGYYALVDIPDVIDTLGPEEAGPLERTYEVEVYEGPPLDCEGMDIDRGHRRTLWKKSFRVTATAAEIEALRR